MTDKELMQQALEALEKESKGYAGKVTRNRPIIKALRDRLAEPMYMDVQRAMAWSSSPAGQIVLDELEKRLAPILISSEREACIGIVNRHGGSTEIVDAIRARGQA